MSFLNSKQYDKAEETFRQAIKSNPTNLIYQCQLGLTLIQAKIINNFEELCDFFKLF